MMNKQWKFLCQCFIACGFTAFCYCSFASTFPVQDKEAFVNLKYRLMAAQFLSLATFGPTPEEIEALAGRIEFLGRRQAFSEWIDQQFNKPASFHEPLALQMILDDGFQPLSQGINPTRYVQHAWWHTALTADDQLRQRVAWALSQIFVINRDGPGFRSQSYDASGQPQYLGIANYYDMLLRNSFGNYRTLLKDVSLHPIMGTFLSHAKNAKGDPLIQRFPDENYARELLQLFSIGLFEMQGDGSFKKGADGQLIETYDNDTIANLARVFTGLSYARGSDFYRAKLNFHQPMIMFEDWHDREPKTLLRGKTLPAGQRGMQDIHEALENLFRHPNVPPFIARLLIQRFVTSNPSRPYINRVSRIFIDNGDGVRGDLKAVLKAILLDPEAIDTQHYAMLRDPPALLVTKKPTEYSRLREPLLRYAAFYRAFSARSNYHSGRFMIPDLYYVLNQAPYRAPSVFNFYRADYQPPGDLITYEPATRIPNGLLHAPEFEVMTPTAEISMANLFSHDVSNQSARFRLIKNAFVGEINADVELDFSTELRLAANPAALLSHLDLLLCHGGLSDESKDIIAKTISQGTSLAQLRAKLAIITVLTVSDCAVE